MQALRIFAFELIPPSRDLRQRYRIRAASNSSKSSCAGESSSRAELAIFPLAAAGEGGHGAIEAPPAGNGSGLWIEVG
jgi:hypothetical protein